MTDSFKFAIGGAVQIKNGTYLERPADRVLLEACQAGEFAYVLACRQIGKSSLMNATEEKLRQSEVKTAVIDLTEIGTVETAASWYFSLTDQLALRLTPEVDAESWWESQPSLSTPIQRFQKFLREVILQKISKPIVIFVDEIDFTLGFEFTEDFFAAIRAIYQGRVRHPSYKRLTFVLVGAATPDQLMPDSKHTPFNIGKQITLPDFTREECQPLYKTIKAKYPQQGADYFDQIYTWTKGHPYLTQKLCHEVVQAAEADSPELVETLVRQIFITPEDRGDDDNLRYVQRGVTEDARAQEMLKIYQRLLQNEDIMYDEKSVAINRLRLYGLVVIDRERLRIRNNLYARVFDDQWVADILNKTRRVALPKGVPEKYKGISRLCEDRHTPIYLAQDLKFTETQFVALKLRKLQPHARRSLTEEIRRFSQFQQIKHPNLIDIIEVGAADDNTLFTALEYISGGTLREKLVNGPLSFDQALGVMKQIGNALTELHRHGIIHCDVNPNNILLDITKDPLRVVLTDFDSAIFLSENHNSLNPDEPGRGTLSYAAPEQFTKEPLTPATDIYALAIVFFEMIAGRSPFEDKVMDKQFNNFLPRFSSLAPQSGGFFDATLARAADKDRGQRFQQVVEFISALEAAYRRKREAQAEAAAFLEQAEREMKKKGYRARFVSLLIEESLKEHPKYAPALLLLGKFHTEQNELTKALEAYEKAYVQTLDSSSPAGEGYLNTLEQLAETAWEREQHRQAIQYDETIIHNFPEKRKRSVKRLLGHHKDEAEQAYAGQKPEAMDTPIQALKRLGGIEEAAILASKQALLKARVEYNKVNTIHTSDYDAESITATDEALKALNASLRSVEATADSLREPEVFEVEKIIEGLHYKQNALEIRRCRQAIKHHQAVIANILANHDLDQDDIFQHYDQIDAAYQRWLALDAPNGQKIGRERQQTLRERAQYRLSFAQMAEKNEAYDQALEHYRALQWFEQEGFPGILDELDPDRDLEAIIKELEDEVEFIKKYFEIITSINQQAHSDALDKVFTYFIKPAKYEYRDVARLFWGLVYAQQQGGAYPPPEWEELPKLRKTLAEREDVLKNARREVDTVQEELAKLQQKKRGAISRNSLIFSGIVLSLMVNLLFSFLFREQINNLTKGLVVIPIIMIGLAGILILYQRIRRQ